MKGARLQIGLLSVNRQEIGVSPLVAGVYFLRVGDGQTISFEKRGYYPLSFIRRTPPSFITALKTHYSRFKGLMAEFGFSPLLCANPSTMACREFMAGAALLVGFTGSLKGCFSGQGVDEKSRKVEAESVKVDDDSKQSREKSRPSRDSIDSG